MIVVLLIPNPFEAHKHEEFVFEKPMSPNEWLRTHDTSEAEKRGPLICLKNKVPLLREHWDTPIEDGDSLAFMPAVAWTQIIWMIVITIISVVVSLALTPSQKSTPDMPSQADVKEGDPVFTLRGQQNKQKLAQPIEKCYGRFRHWPSYAAAPYTRFIDNDSYLYQLFCLGLGRVQIHEIFIEDTPITDFQSVEYEVVEPGGTVTLFPDNVYSSTEVANIELFGPNQESYTGFAGGFVACPPLTTTRLIECDLLFPRGLYYSNDLGGLDARTSTVEIQIRKIDDAGAALSEWVSHTTFTRTMATNTPQRFTVSMIVEEARYQVRARRSNDADTSHRAADTVTWGSLRAFLDSQQVYEGVTMLVVKARATNNLNDSASSRVNFTGTARIPVWTPEGGWVEDVTTRSPVWAFCDVFCAAYGGNLDRSFLDLESLHALDQELANEGIYFDWVFENRTTTWDIAKTIAMVCRATPLLVGSRIGMVRERPQVLPVGIYSANNIAENTLSIDVKLRGVNDHDGLEIEYLNPETWQPETVLCLGPGDQGFNLKNVKLPGCTNRTKAYRAGMYMRMSELLVVTNVKWKTGMEGFLPTYGDLVAVSHSFPRWGKNGFVKEIAGNEVTVDTDLELVPAQTHYILIRRKDGSVHGPSVVEAINGRVLTLSEGVTPGDFFMEYGEPPLFMFGHGGSWGKMVRIVNLRPEGNETIQIEATNYNPGIFAYDLAVPPALNSGFYLPGVQTTPKLTGLEVRKHLTDDSLVSLTWLEVLDALHYVIQTSSNGVDYTTITETTVPFYFLPVLPGVLWIRVFAVRVGAGQAAEWKGLVGVDQPLPGNVTGAVQVSTFTGLQSQFSWDSLSGVDGYRVRVFTRPTSGSWRLARTVQTEAPALTYTLSDATVDRAVNREHRILVTGMNLTGESPTPAEVLASNPAPVPALPQPWVLLFGTQGAPQEQFRLSWIGDPDPDIAFYRVKVKVGVYALVSSGQSDPTPLASTSDVASGTVIYEGTGTSVDVWLPTISTAYGVAIYVVAPHWWRVYTVDVWGNEVISSALHFIRRDNVPIFGPIAP